MMQRRVAIMGDGGFWHNGLLTGVQSALFNGDDAVLLIFKNGYTSATGTQDIINTPDDEAKEHARQGVEPGAHQPDHRERAQGPGRAMAAHACTPTRSRRCAPR
jgi:indolepyruvate ferredoxin oxidoreductase alpha subunit